MKKEICSNNCIVEMSMALDSIDYYDDPWAEEDLLDGIFGEKQSNVGDPVLPMFRRRQPLFGCNG